MATEPLPPDLTLPSVTAAQSAAPFAGRVQLVALDSIRVPERRLRMRSEPDALRESIAANGLLQPVLLDENFGLVCGLLRVEAARQLGWREIPAVVRGLRATEARLAELDENLCRRELSVLERAEHIALRRKLWEELRKSRDALAPANDTAGAAKKDSKAAAKKREKEAKKADEAALTAFVDETARKTGRAQAVLREELRIGELPEEVRDLARETPIVHNRRELLALAKMDDEERLPALERVRSGESKSVRKPKPRKPKEDELDDELDGEGAEGPSLASETELLPSAARRKRAVVHDDAPPPSSEEIRDRLARMLGGGDEAAGETEALAEALETAVQALEHALALWPEGRDVSGDGELPGDEVLRQAAGAVRRLASALRR